MSELPDGVDPAREIEPRDSASGVVVRRRADGAWQVLLGLRSRRARFMAGHLAFPGGVVERADRPEEGGVHARCVARELREETGIEIPAAAWVAAGERTTPPIFPVRYRTRFFVAALPGRVEAGSLAPASGENERLQLEPAGRALRQWLAGTTRLPPPVLPILRALAGSRAASHEELAPLVAAANRLEEQTPRIEFVPDVWLLPVRTATLPPATHTNVWMPGGERFAIVDPGSADPAEVARLVAVVGRRREQGHEPAAVLLTHHHGDHAAGAAAVGRAVGVPVRAHRETLRRLGPQLGDLAQQALDDGERIDLGGTELRAWHTPGHAPGHLVFELPARGVLVAGDLVSGLSTILIDPAEGDMQAYLGSLRRAAGLGARILLPGHGPPLAPSALGRAVAHRLGRERAILAGLAAGAGSTVAQTARRAYAGDPAVPVALAERQTLAHLVRLERDGRAVRRGPGRWAAVPAAAAGIIEQRLRERFRPLYLRLRDDSARHAGHPGATSGGGHFELLLVSAAFEGLTRLDQHRLVHEALGDLFGREIHALGLRTYAPAEWPGAESGQV